MKRTIRISDRKIVNRIYFLRGKKIMLDRDLAEMYGVEVKRMKEAVRRNLKRFPKDFMFQMTVIEFENLRTQFASLNQEKRVPKYAPFCFTEQGVAMLSSILNSETAIEVNIKIIRIFTRMREMFTTNKDILFKLEQMEKKINGHDKRLLRQGNEIRIIFDALKKLLLPLQTPRKKIGFRRSDE